MQCAVCGTSIDELCVMCPYCGHVSTTPPAGAPPLIAAHELPIVYATVGDAPRFPFEEDQTRHARLKRLLLCLVAAEMLIACIGLMTLPSANASRKPPTSGGQASHHSGETFERIAVATKPVPTPLPTTTPVVTVAPAAVVAPHLQPHRMAPKPPQIRPTATPTAAPSPTSLPAATPTLAPPTALPMPTPTATPPPIDTPTPTISTPPPTITPSPISTPSPVTPSPSPTPPTPQPTVTRR